MKRSSENPFQRPTVRARHPPADSHLMSEMGLGRAKTLGGSTCHAISAANWDDIDRTLRRTEQIAIYRRARVAAEPWIMPALPQV